MDGWNGDMVKRGESNFGFYVVGGQRTGLFREGEYILFLLKCRAFTECCEFTGGHTWPP